MANIWRQANRVSSNADMELFMPGLKAAEMSFGTLQELESMCQTKRPR